MSRWGDQATWRIGHAGDFHSRACASRSGKAIALPVRYGSEMRQTDLLPESTMNPAPLAALSRRELMVGLTRAGCAALMLGGSHSARSVERFAAANAQPDIETLRILRSRIELQFAPGFSQAFQAAARSWVIRSADAVARYFGRFPVPKVELLLVPEDGSGVRTGVTYAEPSLLIRIRLGRDTNEAQFIDDWVLVHEMVHLAIPRIPRAQNWLHEGVAYVR